ncbi:MAG: hypothetical protein ACO27F_05015 [Beijerinckiaceae bacterium]
MILRLDLAQNKWPRSVSPIGGRQLNRFVMVRDFVRLFSLLTTLEREFGIAGLEKEERAVFDFIVHSIAEGKYPTRLDVVAQRIASRASTYRHIAALQAAGLIIEIGSGKALSLDLSPKLDGFGQKYKLVPND